MSRIKQILENARAPIGGLGFLAWLGAFQGHAWLEKKGYELVADGVSGYMVGVVSAVALWVFKKLYNGKLDQLVDSHPIWKLFSYMGLALILSIGIASFFSNIFGDKEWTYNVGFALGGFIIGVCFLPVLDEIDNI